MNHCESAVRGAPGALAGTRGLSGLLSGDNCPGSSLVGVNGNIRGTRVVLWAVPWFWDAQQGG